MDGYLGEIRMFSGNYAPGGWQLCDGTMMSVSGNEALFTLLGVGFGGDGINTFGVPDMRGRLPVSMGQGAGLQARTLGATGGNETVSLIDAQNPPHFHPLSALNIPGTTVTPGTTVMLAAAQTSGDYLYVNGGASGATAVELNAAALTTAGGSAGHENIMPSLGVTFIICTAGIFPSQN
jgi:microcystin-dependent protein